MGIQVAHSGNVAGVLFDAAVPGLAERLEAANDRLDAAGLTPHRVFSTSTRSGTPPVPSARPVLTGVASTPPTPAPPPSTTAEPPWTSTFPKPSPDPT